MATPQTFSAAANLLIVAGLLLGGLNLLAGYYAKGRWAKNLTGLLAGFGHA